MMKRVIVALSAAALTASMAAPALAQTGLEGRVGKLEGEMRAVQRKVFPNGAGAVVAPEIAPATSVATQLGTPSQSALADLTSRVSSLEQQQATLTGQIEQAQHRLRLLEDQFTAYRKATDAKLSSAEATVTAAGNTASTAGQSTPVAASPAAPAKTTAGAASGGSARAKLVAAVAKPDTGDAPEDAYLYGYRLWAAKLYPEAADQLKKFVATWPKHRRASYAQNLLGRSYLDDGKPSLASIAFYDNYKKYPEGERAPESLYYLGSALTRLNKPADACKVYGELSDVYGDKISAGMKADVAKARTAAKCK